MNKFISLMMIMTLVFALFGCTPATKPVDGPAEPIEEPDGQIIKPVDKVDIENLTILDEFEFDFDKDEEMEKISMLTTAQKDSKGEIAWDDGQNWMLIVQDKDKDYVLVDEYVQLGMIDFNVFTIDEEFYISTYSPRTASLTLNIYQYDRDNDSFIMTTPYNPSGNVNMIKTSGGY